MKSSYSLPLILSVILHAALLSVLFLDISVPNPATPIAQPKVDIIKAVAVDSAKVQATLDKIKAEQQAKIEALKQKRIQEQKRLARLKAEKQRKAREKVAKVKAEKLRKAKLKKQAVEKKRLAEINRKKQIADKKRQQELAKRKAADKTKRLAETKRKKRIEDSLQQQLSQEQQQRTAARSKQIQSEVSKYKSLIIQAIGHKWIVPDKLKDDLSCALSIKLAPGGAVIDVRVIKSSGDSVLDRSALAAVYKASPLPVPTTAELFDKFRELRLTVRPEGYIS